jgi:fluoride exporter
MSNIIYVFIGGGLGSILRYLLSGAVYRWTNSMFPFGTIVVNTTGCFFIGLMMAGMGGRFIVNPSLRIFLTIGFLGGFTTFSTFSYETIALLKDGEILFSAVNIIGSFLVCLAATYAGTLVGKLF